MKKTCYLILIVSSINVVHNYIKVIRKFVNFHAIFLIIRCRLKHFTLILKRLLAAIKSTEPKMGERLESGNYNLHFILS